MLSELDEVERRRKRLGLTQAKLASLAVVSRSSIAKIETAYRDKKPTQRARYVPNYEDAKRILEALEREEEAMRREMGQLTTEVLTRPPETSPPVTRPAVPDPRFIQPIVGRKQELSILRQRLDAALSGAGGLVLITGEAGIGKTRLAFELKPYATERGFLWLEGRYYKEEGIPFQPWAEAIRSFLRIAPSPMMPKVLLPYGGELAKVVAEVAERLGRVPSLPSAAPEEERARFLESVAGFFVAVARQQPLVVLIDDLQWAPSLDVLQHVARGVARERLLLLGTYRDGELKEKPGLTKTILAMNRERLFSCLPLRRLNEGEVTQMVALALGKAASAKLAKVVYQKTDGIPFFVEEVVRNLTESGAVHRGEKGWEVREPTLIQVPDSVKVVIEERVARLGEDAQAVLAWASVAGQEFTLPLLKEVTGLEEEKLLKVVDRAVASRVMNPRRYVGQEAYAFVDDQIRDVLYDGIGPARRRRYHLKVGQALENLHARRLEEYYEALARHFLEGNDLEKALEYSIKGDERAYAVFSWQRAVSHFETALELLEELPKNLPRQAQMLERLADLDNLLGRQGLNHIQEALELYIKLGEKRKAARMHGLMAVQVEAEEDMEKALPHSEEAVKLLKEEPDSPEKALANSKLAFSLSAMLDLERALEQGREALQIVERVKDPEQVAYVCTEVALALAHCGKLSQAREYAERSWEAANQGKDAWLKARAGVWPLALWPWMNDRAWSEQWVERCMQYRRHSHVERYDLLMYSVSALHAALSGRPQKAAECLLRAEEFAFRHPYLHRYAVHSAGAAHAVLGDWEQASRLLGGSLEAAENAHFRLFLAQACMHYGRFLLTCGDISEAEKVLVKGYTLACEKGSVVQELNLLPLLCELNAKTGRLAEAKQNLKRVLELTEISEPWRGLMAGVYLAEGILETTKGSWPNAEKAFAKAQEAERTYGFVYNEGRLLVEWGKLYLTRDGAGDREHGMLLLEHAREIFQGCNAKKDLDRVLALREVKDT